MVATTVIQPVDMVKVRLQLAGEGANALSITREIIAAGKVRDLYTGLSAGECPDPDETFLFQPIKEHREENVLFSAATEL